MIRTAIALGAVLLAAACSGDDGNGGKDAARAAAQEQADRFTSGDFGGAWDMWTAEAQSVMSREDYVEFSKTCSETGAPLDVSSVRVDGDDATVRLALGDFERAYQMHYEGGEWRWQPTGEALDMYAEGLEGAIAAAKADGSCA